MDFNNILDISFDNKSVNLSHLFGTIFFPQFNISPSCRIRHLSDVVRLGDVARRNRFRPSPTEHKPPHHSGPYTDMGKNQLAEDELPALSPDV